MLIAGVSLFLSVLVLVSARWLYHRSLVFFLLCNACEERFRKAAPGSRGGGAGRAGIEPGPTKMRGAAAP
jgi:hypothetical protein